MSRLAPSTAWLPTAALFAVLMTFVVGCGQASSGVSLAGNVSLQGQPIANGAVMFFPPHGRAIVTTTNATGDYAVKLEPGQYDVTVNTSVQLPAGWKEGDPVPPQKTVLPTIYTTRVKTPLQATVAASGAQSIDFDLP
jgi:hypothetical protein